MYEECVKGSFKENVVEEWLEDVEMQINTQINHKIIQKYEYECDGDVVSYPE